MNKKAFTLIEVLIAITIFAIAVLAVQSLIGYSLALGTLSDHRVEAINSVRQTVEKIRSAVDTNSLGSACTQTLPANVTVSFDPSNCTGKLVTATVTASWAEKGRTFQHTVVTKLTQR